MTGSAVFRTGSVCCVLLLAGCASQVPLGIREAPATAISVIEGQNRGDSELLGKAVRWGGEVVRVQNLAEVTRVEVLARRLGNEGEPEPEGEIDARFIAQFQGFIDPSEYQAGERLTVQGRIAGTEVNKLGDYPYRYPVVLVEESHRWPRPPAVVRVRSAYPYFYDPWYRPWHPYWPYWW